MREEQGRPGGGAEEAGAAIGEIGAGEAGVGEGLLEGAEGV